MFNKPLSCTWYLSKNHTSLHALARVYVCKMCKNRIAVEDIDEIYQLFLKGYLHDINPEDFLQESDAILNEKKSLLSVTVTEHAKLLKKSHELIDIRLNGELTKESFPPLHKPIEERLAQMTVQIPELEGEISFREIQLLSTDTVLTEAKQLYEQWHDMAFEAKRAIVETITDHIEVGTEDINITLSYLPPFTKRAEMGNTTSRDGYLNLKSSAFSRRSPDIIFQLDLPGRKCGSSIFSTRAARE